MDAFYKEIGAAKVVPVIVLSSLEEVVPVIDALREGGLKTAEITLRTECAQSALRLAAEKYGEQARRAIANGAKFIVGPGFSREVCDVCREKGTPYLPGCVTPTEIIQALSCGISVVKFFPAGLYGGIGAIKALSSVFPQVRFVPTGGVNAENMEEYLACKKVLAVGGSWMTKGTAEQIAQMSRECAEKAEKQR